MRIHFLDASTLHRNDLDFSPFEKHGELSLYPTTSKQEIIAHSKEADVIVTNKVPIDTKTVSQLPQLKLVLIAATGFNHINLTATRKREIPVCNVAGYSSSAVAQHVFALLLNLVTATNRYHQEIQTWPQSPIFTHLDFPVAELAGKTMGIVGLGETGSAVARIAEAFGMRVQALARDGASGTNRTRVPSEEFFSTSDVISLHCPLNTQTQGIINARSLTQMKPSSYLINTGRGALIDETALANSLIKKEIAGAGLDVLSTEPPEPSHPLLSSKILQTNLIITPHTAWTAREARQRLLDGLLMNLEAWISGTPDNLVN